jgi:hypothetical protein
VVVDLIREYAERAAMNVHRGEDPETRCCWEAVEAEMVSLLSDATGETTEDLYRQIRADL